MPTLASQWRAFWHTMLSEDRHASHDSPYRSGAHQPLPQNRHTPLTSVATSALESRTDLNAAYKEDLESGHGFVNGAAPVPTSPNRPYSPGMRTSLQRQSSAGLDGKNMQAVGVGEIQMQSFSDGLPPAPPVAHSWKRIDRWLEDHYEELFENMGVGATLNDVNELEHELDCSLPQEVRESLQVHDGQERGGMPTGVLFGCMLLDCEEIMQEWQNWRTMNEVYFGDSSSSRAYDVPAALPKAFASSSNAVPLAQPQNSSATNTQWRQELLDKQDSQPANAVQKAYAHPAWIPLARDWGGNNICVDLAPGPTGKWGQVILTGRDYDCKYVVARSWAAFLATLADDLTTTLNDGSGASKAFIDEDTKELKLREFPRQPGVEPPYIDILRWRADQKYGRKGPKKRPLRINSQVAPAGAPNGTLSPYSSPTSGEDRGRSPQRAGKAPATSSPRAHVSSPLARVAEETPTPPHGLKVDTSMSATKPEKLIPIDTPRSALTASTAPGLVGGKPEKLVPVDTPVASEPPAQVEDKMSSLPKSRLSNILTQNGDGEEEKKKKEGAVNGESMAEGGAEEEMKDVQI